tara:strand:- start:71 stop:1432 length:1362 start_codon:yes stop_codon:yes gene_type:complete
MALLLPNSLFIHIPKTGGTWVRRAIEKSMGLEKDSSEIVLPLKKSWGKLAHARVKDTRRYLKEGFDDKFSFSFVRQPLDWLKSSYIDNVYPEFVDYDLSNSVDKKISFKEFVFNKGEGFVSNLYREYLQAFIGLYPCVDYIGKIENLKADLIEALDLAGEKFDRDIIDSIPPQRQGASIEKNKKLIDVDEDLLSFVKSGEKEALSLFYSENSYSNMQECIYDRLASLWSLEKKNFVVGPFKHHNDWEDYNLLFDGMFDFHNNTKRLPLAKDLDVLDFGCGPGRNLEKYSSNFNRVDGVDISYINLENAAEWLKETNTHNNNLLFKSNGRDLKEIKDSQYDAVMSVVALQHICVHDIRQMFFKEFYRVLKSGGWVTAQMGYGKGKLGAVSYYKNHYNIGRTNGRTDVYVESPKQLEEDLSAVGFGNFQYKIRPSGPGDSHPNWIFFRARKQVVA